MKKRIITLIMAALLLSVALIPQNTVVIKADDTSNATTQSYQEQIAQLEAKQAELKKQINDLSNQQANAMDIKANMDALSLVTQQKISVAGALSEQLDEQIKEKETAIAQKEEDIKLTKERFIKRLVAAYEEGDTSYLDLILGSESMGEFLSRMDSVSMVLEHDKNLRIQYENEKVELETAKKSLESAKELQAEVLAGLEADKAEYDSLANQQASIISSLENDISAANAAYEQAKAQENALDAELQNYLYQIALEQQRLAEQKRREEEAARQAAQQNNTTPSGTDTTSGNVNVGAGFAWPLPGQTYISSGFGWRTLGGYSDYHRGVDIPAEYGTPIHASKGGQVLRATGHNSYGNYVLIDHGNGESTLYAHMSAIGCSVGQYVNQGDVIGYVGSTGYSTGNHLHFEIRINGEAQNPLGFVSPY